MNKRTLVERVAKETGVTKADTRLMVNAIINAITTELTKGREVTLPSLGILYTSTTKERKCYNPITGEMRWIPERRQVRFRTAADLKRKMNK